MMKQSTIEYIEGLAAMLEDENTVKHYTKAYVKAARHIVRAYKSNIRSGASGFEFSAATSIDCTEALVRLLRNADVEEIAISCSFTHIFDMLAVMESLGCKISGICEIVHENEPTEGGFDKVKALSVRIAESGDKTRSIR